MRNAALLSLSRELHEAHGLAEVMDRVVAAVAAGTRYQRAWLVMPMEPNGLEVVGYAVPDRQQVDLRMAAVDVAKDRWVAYLMTATEPVVVPDMREVEIADQAQVAHFGNRTLICVPMLRMAERLGALCIGTFAAEGVVPPTADELAFAVQVAALVSVVAGRIRAEASQRALEEKVRGAQRLESLGRLAGEIAHDFNNMLVAIVGNADMADEMLKGHPARELVSEIQMAARRASGLTRQLLAFSRGQPLERRGVDLEAVVDALAPMLRSLLPANIALEIVHGRGLGTVHGDAGQLEQVLMNLVVNARDALPAGGRIHVETENVRVDAPYAAAHPPARVGSYVLLSVSDTGVGMPLDVASRVFEPFFSTKGPGAGTGLGLAVVESVVRRHDGFINVYSEPGRGTSFKVYLPVSERRAEDVGSKLPAAPSLERGTEHVLVVDDDAQVRVILERVLSAAGYRVTSAEDGRAALAALDEHDDVALVITDLVMPSMGGDALRDAVAARARPLPVLIMSGYARGAAAQGSFEHVLSKPFSPQALLHKVRAILDAKRPADADGAR